MSFSPGAVRNFSEALAAAACLFARWHKAALARGVFLAPSAFEAGFVSSAHSDAGIGFTITELDAALGEARGRYRRGLGGPGVCGKRSPPRARPRRAPAAGRPFGRDG